MEYTGRYKGWQIRDVSYVGDPPEDAPIEFALVKWFKSENDEREYCYVVGELVYDEHEPCFDFNGIGLRIFEEQITPDVCDWVQKWCQYKLAELDVD